MTGPKECRREAVVIRYRTGWARWRAVCRCGWSEWGSKQDAEMLAVAHNEGRAA